APGEPAVGATVVGRAPPVIAAGAGGVVGALGFGAAAELETGAAPAPPGAVPVVTGTEAAAPEAANRKLLLTFSQAKPASSDTDQLPSDFFLAPFANDALNSLT